MQVNRYMEALESVLRKAHGTPSCAEKKMIDFHYEPIVALHNLLSGNDKELIAIGGAPQMVKIYPYCSSLPIVVKTKLNGHHLLGRKLFSWEKTEYPILDLTSADPDFIYPMSFIPKPDDIQPTVKKPTKKNRVRARRAF